MDLPRGQVMALAPAQTHAAPGPGRMLGDALGGRNNALNFVRLCLALTVIGAHTWQTGGFGYDPQFGDLNVGVWAVCGFFTISGYLICDSRHRLPWRSFAVSRALRIYPAYWAALALVGLVLAPLAALSTGTRADWTGGLRYVVVNLTTMPYQLAWGEAITRAANPTNWNAPLWSLPHEMFCYLLVGLGLGLRWLRDRVTLVVSGLLLGVTAFNGVLASWGVAWGYMPSDFLRLFSFFAAGSLLWALRERVPVRWSWTLASAALFVATAATGTTGVLGALPLAYLLLGVGALAPIRVGAVRDLSYGLYVVGWPVQTTVYLAGGHRLGAAGFLAVTLAVALPLAYCSWRWVEAPSLRLAARLRQRYAARSGERAAYRVVPAGDEPRVSGAAQ